MENQMITGTRVDLLVELDGSYKKVHYLQRYNRA